MWAAASPRRSFLPQGLDGADSWATDAHKTLNTPYDCGIAIVRQETALRRAFGHEAAYLLHSEEPDPHEHVPELSRRARGVPVWAALRTLGVDGLADLVDGLVHSAAGIADGLRDLEGIHVLHDVVYTQVTACLDNDELTDAVLASLLAEGCIRPSASSWHGRHVIRFSVSSHLTDERAVRQSVEAVRRALVSCR